VAAYRNWRGRLVVARFVDVATLVEVQGPDGLFPMAHVLRDADARSVTDLSRELRAVKTDPRQSRSGRLLSRWSAPLARLPGLLRLMYVGLGRVQRLRSQAGTVAVTSVGMFAGGRGHAIGYPTIMSMTVLVGGSSERPAVVDGEIVVRRMLDLTVSVDHRIVDGAPAARFAADLRRHVESAGQLA
jgi:pyruvate/2-oxoglutarate dehydrogenase complex dihydrolipoamide acyltransferase (E2) component